MKKTLLLITGLLLITFANHAYSLTNKFLSLHKAGNGKGIIINTFDEVLCKYNCKSSYPYGSSITLTAEAEKGSEFIGWTGDCSVDSENKCNIVIDKDIKINAMFTTITNKKIESEYSPEMITRSVSGVLALVKYLGK